MRKQAEGYNPEAFFYEINNLRPEIGNWRLFRFQIEIHCYIYIVPNGEGIKREGLVCDRREKEI